MDELHGRVMMKSARVGVLPGSTKAFWSSSWLVLGSATMNNSRRSLTQHRPEGQHKHQTAGAAGAVLNPHMQWATSNLCQQQISASLRSTSRLLHWGSGPNADGSALLPPGSNPARDPLERASQRRQPRLP